MSDTDEPTPRGAGPAQGGCYTDADVDIDAGSSEAAAHGAAAGPPYADCVQCGEPTEYPVARPGIVLCPVCEWQEAQRSACSG
ncbi:hypothetical protein FCH28_25385 [Streptomyces piniterrae]|uniref:Uncharacterized protein n=1 Tax=Streptomyces piniterrae TaxID=2571125 RepID=A0A4U0N755_9ACTN|nr:hypothetical protein [Streptomyces piniterrae]TJZ49617.1 hypothetical protein FCH28_25385 [Streptomyces piniterrae]